MLLFLILKTKQPIPLLAEPPKRVVWKSCPNNGSLPILSLNPFQSRFWLWHSTDTNIHHVANGTDSPQPSLSDSSLLFATVATPLSLNLLYLASRTLSFPVFLSYFGVLCSFSFPDLCPGNSSRCHYTHSMISSNVIALRKNFCWGFPSVQIQPRPFLTRLLIHPAALCCFYSDIQYVSQMKHGQHRIPNLLQKLACLSSSPFQLRAIPSFWRLRPNLGSSLFCLSFFTHLVHQQISWL